MYEREPISAFEEDNSASASTEQTQSLLIAFENQKHCKVISRALQTRYANIDTVPMQDGFEQAVKRFEPALLVFELDMPTSQFFHRLKRMNWDASLAIAMFTAAFNSRMIDESTDAGVNAFVVQGLDEERIRVVAELAQSRFRQLSALNKQLNQSRSELADRKTIEKAKGILMRQKGIAEDEAYHMLRKMAMKQNAKLVSVARKLISVADLLA